MMMYTEFSRMRHIVMINESYHSLAKAWYPLYIVHGICFEHDAVSGLMTPPQALLHVVTLTCTCFYYCLYCMGVLLWLLHYILLGRLQQSRTHEP